MIIKWKLYHMISCHFLIFVFAGYNLFIIHYITETSFPVFVNFLNLFSLSMKCIRKFRSVSSETVFAISHKVST